MINSNFFRSKIDNFQWKIFDIFLIFAQNIDCGVGFKGVYITRTCFPDDLFGYFCIYGQLKFYAKLSCAQKKKSLITLGTWLRGYKTFLKLSSAEHEISTAHKC